MLCATIDPGRGCAPGAIRAIPASRRFIAVADPRGSRVNPVGRDARPSCIYNIAWRITFDPAKRERTLRERGLDFLDAGLVFEGETFTFDDARRDYGEPRRITVGFLAGRMVVVGWVARGRARHVFSMRKANEREIKAYRQQFEES